LVLLNKEEEAYVKFIENYENVKLKKMCISGLTEENAVQLREQVRELNKSDRAILLDGTKAFTSFIESYVKHDCKIVCRLNDQNVAGIAHSFGLLRLPVIRELRGRLDVVDSFIKSKVATHLVSFKDPAKESERQEVVVAKKEAKEKFEIRPNKHPPKRGNGA